jgi:hypothetical protein
MFRYYNAHMRISKLPMHDFPIISRLGGWDAAYEVITSHLDINTEKVMYWWKRRGRLPGDVMLVLMKESDARGIAYTHKDFSAMISTATEAVQHGEGNFAG